MYTKLECRGRWIHVPHRGKPFASVKFFLLCEQAVCSIFRDHKSRPFWTTLASFLTKNSEAKPKRAQLEKRSDVSGKAGLVEMSRKALHVNRLYLEANVIKGIVLLGQEWQVWGACSLLTNQKLGRPWIQQGSPDLRTGDESDILCSFQCQKVKSRKDFSSFFIEF